MAQRKQFSVDDEFGKISWKNSELYFPAKEEDTLPTKEDCSNFLKKIADKAKTLGQSKVLEKLSIRTKANTVFMEALVDFCKENKSLPFESLSLEVQNLSEIQDYLTKLSSDQLSEIKLTVKSDLDAKTKEDFIKFIRENKITVQITLPEKFFLQEEKDPIPFQKQIDNAIYENILAKEKEQLLKSVKVAEQKTAQVQEKMKNAPPHQENELWGQSRFQLM